MQHGKAILINPFMKTVTEVPYQYGGSYTQITDYIATPEAPKPLFTCVGINDEGDSIFVDDEGLYRETQAFFEFEGYPQPLQGFGLVLGCDDEGETVAPSVTLDQVAARISWAAGIAVEPSFTVRGFDNAEDMLKAMLPDYVKDFHGME